jgi:hypothetical protein
VCLLLWLGCAALAAVVMPDIEPWWRESLGRVIIAAQGAFLWEFVRS